ncbi:hypothetical protein B0H14DRAFT_2631545 [Mycena olivaceomarginata]|nr:hypothetical protein B0H14DRAFT_2631545 [Mycena olivaceomarginata]
MTTAYTLEFVHALVNNPTKAEFDVISGEEDQHSAHYFCNSGIGCELECGGWQGAVSGLLSPKIRFDDNPPERNLKCLKIARIKRPTGALDGIPNDFGTLQHVSKNFEELQSPYYQYSLKLEVTTWCVIVIVAGQKSNCPEYSRFSYQTASVSETKNPSSNVLALCPTSSCSAVIWKYVLHRHFKECHPGLPQSVYDAQVISATEKGLLKVLWDNRHMKTQRKSKKSKQKKGIEHQQRVIAHEFSRSRSVF